MNSKSREIAPNFGNRVSQPGQERFWCCAQADSPLVSQLTFATDFRNMKKPMFIGLPRCCKTYLCETCHSPGTTRVASVWYSWILRVIRALPHR